MNQSADRRPIAARGNRAVVAAATWLIRRETSANAVSVAGMGSGLLAGLAAASVGSGPESARLLWLATAVLVQLRLLANLLDGMVAIGRGVASPVGELFNEVPDRVSDTAVLAGLGVAAGQPALGLAAALAAMATAYVRVLGRASGMPSDFSGPMAKQHRMAVATAAALWCAAAPHDWVRPALLMALWTILVLAIFTAARRLAGLAASLEGAARS